MIVSHREQRQSRCHLWERDPEPNLGTERLSMHKMGTWMLEATYDGQRLVPRSIPDTFKVSLLYWTLCTRREMWWPPIHIGAMPINTSWTENWRLVTENWRIWRHKRKGMPLRSAEYGSRWFEDAQKMEQTLAIWPPVAGSVCFPFPDLSEYPHEVAFTIMTHISGFMDPLKFEVCLLLVDRGLMSLHLSHN